jgi:uncharacterized protein (DUF885 family)
MTMQKLRGTADALHNLAPEGIHVPHWHGTKADRDKLAADIKASKNPFEKKAMREYHDRFLVLDEGDAAKHEAIVARLPAAADRLIEQLGLRGPGVHPVPAQDGQPEVLGVIAEADAKRYIIKTLRELRQKVGNKATVDLTALAAKVAEHLGVESVEAISEELSNELAAFTLERDAAKEMLGGHAQCHEDLGFIDARLQTP